MGDTESLCWVMEICIKAHKEVIWSQKIQIMVMKCVCMCTCVCACVCTVHTHTHMCIWMPAYRKSIPNDGFVANLEHLLPCGPVF